jgi:hypothetical protein
MNSLDEALHLIGATPGYEALAQQLAQLRADGKIRFDENLEDRAQAGLWGTITLGPEAIESSALSLAQTLVHEAWHLRQNPFLKTVSFWSGVFTRTHPMRRYEAPAYRAAWQFLEAVKMAHPPLAIEAQAEQIAIRQVYESTFGGALS